jgi:transposase
MVPEEEVHMPRSHPPYPPEFRAEAVRLVRSGERTPEGLARDLGCSAQAIRTWVKQAELDTGHRHDGLTTAEREELARLRRENRVRREEREILRQAATFFAKEAPR